ncbi:hypothetical protein BDK51DRAFT_17113, partial [Blyttiomyces helicus]
EAQKAAKKLAGEETALTIEGQKEIIANAEKKNKRLANLEMVDIMGKDNSNLPDIVRAFSLRKQRK